jgi:hypothetical protein
MVAQVAVLLIQQAVVQEHQVKVIQVVMLPLIEAVVEVEEQLKQVKDLCLAHKTPHPLNMVGMAEMELHPLLLAHLFTEQVVVEA